MISAIFFILAGISNAIMDKILFHWDRSIFKGSRWEWWANPATSYRNKWKNGSNSQDGEKFLGSSTIFVWVTDLWHFAQSFMITFCILGAIFYGEGMVSIFDTNWLNSLLDLLIYKCLFSLSFEIWWSILLERPPKI